MRYRIIIIIIIILGFAFTGWQLWKLFGTEKSNQDDIAEQLYPSINGTLVSAELANLRPLAIVIENHPDARPQSGLTDAEIVYETLAEGGITRFLALFQTKNPDAIGPVRSARPYFNFLADMWAAPIVHSGGSKEALSELSAGVYQNLFDINEFYYGDYFTRDKSRFAPHNLYTTQGELRKILKDKQEEAWQTKLIWTSQEIPAEQIIPEVTQITIPFSTQSYEVQYRYNPENNHYQRTLGAIAQTDENNNLEITPKNIIIQLADIVVNSDDPLLTVDIKMTGSGPCYLFTAGKFISCRWKYDNGRHYYTTEDGNPLQLQPGQTWIEVFPRNKQNSISWN